jgi:trehalose 2-sulfotransferase
LLSEGLAATSVAGRPREWFNVLEEQQHRARWRMDHSSDLSYSQYLDLVKARSATANGIRGIKLHYYQFAELPRKMSSIENGTGLTAAQCLASLFPGARHIWLTRRDKARQAISLLIASKTGQWWKLDRPEQETTKENNDYEFDPHAIALREKVLTASDVKWKTYFEENQLSPLIIYYEDLVSNYAGTITSVLQWLGVPDGEAIQVRPTRLKKQSNTRNDDWLARYQAFKGRAEMQDQTAAIGEVDTWESEYIEKPLRVVPHAWRQWVAHSLLKKTDAEEIIRILTSNGYNRESAAAAVSEVASQAEPS